jgi:hypothetical protein
MGMRHSAPRAQRQILITVLLSGAMALAPNVGAGQAASIPDFSGLWGRDSLT